ncbi:MAG: NAD-dependent epimerase/dehydratase family protein [Pseudomonadales bacterium]|nr:NAD-dependent epimerase/dehydratase family protein [Pseudomonadales bacterium]
MKIFVTGATGLVGAHTTLALLHAGHDVRLLVRNQAAAHSYFLAQGFDLKDFIVTDMLDKEAVKSGMQGCDAVVHMAAIVDLDARNAKRTQATNLQSIDSVIGSACELGIKKILYVSSMSIFYDFTQKMLTENSPLADVKDAYSLSKKLCEIRIRELQAQGKPIITTYPSAVFGPDDPKLAESNYAIVNFFENVLPLTTSGMQFIDARDIAIAHRLLIEGELGEDKTQERYILGGTYTPWADLGGFIEQAAGQKISKVKVPGAIFRLLGVLFDVARIFVPIKFPISKESMRIVTQLPPTTSDKLFAKTGMAFRPVEETLKDTIEWLRKAKHI